MTKHPKKGGAAGKTSPGATPVLPKDEKEKYEKFNNVCHNCGYL